MSTVSQLAGVLVAAAPVFADEDGRVSSAFWRKIPTLLEDEVPPVVVVTLSDQTEAEPLWWHPTGGTDRVTYTAAYTLLTIGGSKVLEDPALRTWQEAARDVLNRYATYAALAGFNAVLAGGKPPYPDGARKATLNYADVVARVEILEIRPA